MGDASGSSRLPTRCPMCKGGVIERQRTSAHGTLIWFHCLFCNHWWKFRADDGVDPNPNGEVTGDVFITKGGTEYKLGSVAVNAIPGDALKKHLESRTLQGELEKQKLRRDIDSLTAALRMAQAEDDRLWKVLQADESNSEKADAWSVEYNKVTNITKQIEDLQAQRQYLATGEYFYEGLPPGISTAKTDDDGKFTLTIPLRGRYGVVARATLELFKESRETHFWFVWVSLDGQPSKRLMLSNDNKMGAGSPDSALQ
jgi:hypothetical protein